MRQFLIWAYGQDCQELEVSTLGPHTLIAKFESVHIRVQLCKEHTFSCTKNKMSTTKVIHLSRTMANPLILADTELVSRPTLDEYIGEGMGINNQHP